MNSGVSSPTLMDDLLRVVFIFVPASFVVGITLFVIIAYFRAYRIDRFKNARRGLLPYHVWTIAISYTLLVLDAAWATSERVRSGLTVHFFLIAPALLLGLYSLYKVLQYERLRYSAEVDMKDITEEDLPQV